MKNLNGKIHVALVKRPSTLRSRYVKGHEN